ncbi:hypothetical protein BYT27DRAFT_6694227 [Phlegmacium glaucopus]|nr:hypothetical protein BYT27DRAFT_6694227 [Phlegmacium glaucopus]
MSDTPHPTPDTAFRRPCQKSARPRSGLVSSGPANTPLSTGPREGSSYLTGTPDAAFRRPLRFCERKTAQPRYSEPIRSGLVPSGPTSDREALPHTHNKSLANTREPKIPDLRFPHQRKPHAP